MFWLLSAFDNNESNKEKHRIFSFRRSSDTTELDPDAVRFAAQTSDLSDEDESATDLSLRVIEAKHNRQAMEKFIFDQRPFIRASASRATGRFVTESDDEYLTAMEAFYESVMKYEPERGSFTSFAGLVIKRRIVDQYRRQQKYSSEISVDGIAIDAGQDLTDEDGVPDPVAMNVQEKVASDDPNRERTNMRLEIEALQQTLSKYGFGFAEMKEAAPSSIKTRENCRKVTCFVLREGLMPRVRREKHLPIQEIKNRLNISPKKIERHRKYIIAVCEILDGDYPYLSEFLGETRAKLRGQKKEHKGALFLFLL